MARRENGRFAHDWQNEHWRCSKCKEYSGALALHIELYPTWICTDCYIELNKDSIMGELI